MVSGRSRAACAVLSCIGLGLAGSAPGDEAAPAAPLEALVAEALQRNPEVLEAQASLDAARERPPQVGALEDPMIGIVYTNDGWTPSLGREDMTTLAVMGSQALPYPGKRELPALAPARARAHGSTMTRHSLRHSGSRFRNRA
jgi:hypothetical protein